MTRVLTLLREVLTDVQLTDPEKITKALEIVEKPWHWKKEIDEASNRAKVKE